MNQNSGQFYEQQALLYLKRKGLKPVTQNYNSRHGEIDLIMLDAKTLVFIEVKYRQQADYGHPVETVTASKQQKLIKAAQHYLQKNYRQQPACRFDVIGISPSKQHSKSTQQRGSLTLDYHWISNAFTST